jgi:hypothetical protein
MHFDLSRNTDTHATTLEFEDSSQTAA